MKRYTFHREDDESLITIQSYFDNERITFALDTGATHTVIDLTRLLLAGYDLRNSIQTVPFESAKGRIEAYTFKVKSIKALGIEIPNMIISAYDFLGNNVITDIDGVLGLDFFEKHKVCIDFNKSEITVFP